MQTKEQETKGREYDTVSGNTSSDIALFRTISGYVESIVCILVNIGFGFEHFVMRMGCIMNRI